MLSRPLRIAVTKFSRQDCPRRIILEIMALEREVEIEQEITQHLLAGKMLHLILQRTFHQKFGYIKYFYHRKGLSLKESIFKAMYTDFHFLSKLFRSNNEIWDSIKIIESIQITEKHLNNLAELAKSLVRIKESRIENLVIQDEFAVSKNIDNILFLMGKVDLVAFTPNGDLRIIELKTGTPKTSDKLQLKLYAELLSTDLPEKNILLELWYTKPEYMKREYISFAIKESFLQQTINKVLPAITKINNSADLPPKTRNTYLCNFCNLCNYLSEIFPEEKGNII